MMCHDGLIEATPEVQFLNDRDKLNKPNSQIGFIERIGTAFSSSYGL